MSNTNEAIVEKNYKIKMSSGIDGEIIEDTNTHTQSEIIDRAKEVLAKEMSLDLFSFAELEGVEEHVGGDDSISYVDKSGNPFEFTVDMQFNAAIAVLNSHGQYFEATPVK